MKHWILFVAFLLFPLLAFSQGVTFEQGSWKEALALAKQTGKPVMLTINFPDLKYNQYFDQDKEVFSREPVGDVCKNYFVCYRMDASKKEGLALANQYGLIKMPTVLFVNADGTLLSKFLLGPSNDFIEQAKKLLLDLKDPKPMTAWEAEYPTKKKDPAFLLEYIDKRINLGLPINEAFDAYLTLLSANEPMPKRAAKLFQLNARQFRVTDYTYQYFSKNNKEFNTIIGIVPESSHWYLQSVVEHTIDLAIMLEDEALLKKAIAAYEKIMDDSETMKVEQLYMNYYQETKQPDKYFTHARLYVADILKKLDLKNPLLERESQLRSIEERLASSETDQANINELNRRKKEIISSGDELTGIVNGIAWSIFQTCSDEAALKEALTWSEKTVQLYPKISMYLDTNANLLYKLGRKEEAIALQKRAVASIDKGPSHTAFSVTLKKMEAGEKFW